MSSVAGAGMGKESTTIVDDPAKHFAVMEDLIQPLQPLAEIVWKLAEQVTDQGCQQHTWSMATACHHLSMPLRCPVHQGTRATTTSMVQLWVLPPTTGHSAGTKRTAAIFCRCITS
jgi:hypothetical protein